MMHQLLCAVLLCVAAAAADTRWFESKTMSHAAQNSTFHPGLQLDLTPYSTTFEYFKKTYKKVYTEGEEAARRGIFEENARFIEKHNFLYARGLKSYFLAINEYADMTIEEFNNKTKGFRQDLHSRNRSGHSTFMAPNNLVLPAKVDWRDQGYVTKVKNQGQCGSCWSFSATGSIEGQHFRKTGTLISLSEQQLMDCSVSYGNNGCNGGQMDYAFQYVRDYGIESEDDYPYEAEEDTCEYSSSMVVAKVAGYTDIDSGSESELQEAVASVGPISVAIDASHQTFQLYSGGVYDEPYCSSSKLDHGVLVVGYGVYGSKDYWLVKNSWGIGWGNSGYIMMSRNKDNQCGIATMASYPLV